MAGADRKAEATRRISNPAAGSNPVSERSSPTRSSRSATEGPAAQEGGTQLDSRSDEELVQEARGGSHAAFEVLVRRHAERAFNVAYRILRDRQLCEDVLQEALIKAYRGLRRFESRSAFYTWLYRIVVNLALDRRRRERGGSHVEWNEGIAHELDPRAVVSEPQDPEADTRRRELRALVASGIEELPDAQREVLLLREVEGLSYHDIAARMRISKGTVMSRLHYARRKLEAFLRRHGVTPEDAS